MLCWRMGIQANQPKVWSALELVYDVEGDLR